MRKIKREQDEMGKKETKQTEENAGTQLHNRNISNKTQNNFVPMHQFETNLFERCRSSWNETI